MGSHNNDSHRHPYKFELDRFDPDAEAMKSGQETVYKPLHETELIFVDTDEKLSQLIDVLKNVNEFAVDLEHHSFRSFQGIVCLMQISTREQDFLVDTLELRRSVTSAKRSF